jgi:hypothetical protein
MDSRTELHVNQVGRGVGAAMNSGLHAVSSEFMAVMHADDICHAMRLRVELDLLREAPTVVAVGSLVRAFSNDSQITALPEPRKSAFRLISWRHLARSNPFTDPTTMFRVSALAEVGGYRRDMTSMQDYELLLRLGAVGDLAIVEDVLLWYRQHPAQFSRRRRRPAEWHALRKARRDLALTKDGRSWRGDIWHVRDLAQHAAASARYRLSSRLTPN